MAAKSSSFFLKKNLFLPSSDHLEFCNTHLAFLAKILSSETSLYFSVYIGINYFRKRLFFSVSHWLQNGRIMNISLSSRDCIRQVISHLKTNYLGNRIQWKMSHQIMFFKKTTTTKPRTTESHFAGHYILKEKLSFSKKICSDNLKQMIYSFQKHERQAEIQFRMQNRNVKSRVQGREFSQPIQLNEIAGHDPFNNPRKGVLGLQIFQG